MKISVPLVIEVDPREWNCGEFAGLTGRELAEAVREDVRRYVEYSVQGLNLLSEADARVNRVRVRGR